ncbi:type VI secretion system Vgr family protein [Aquabacterium sp. A3]|uniref:type VI secretion system Vgr family protein n=1 Tax=Aquabacterium sp. A3 TaxID=3132829 RepID=UPI0031193062
MPSTPHALGASRSWGADLLSRLASTLHLGQHTRLLQLHTPLPEGTLVLERCRIHEGVHAPEPLWAELDCLSTNAHLALKHLTGEQLTVRLMLADGQWRHWHGYAMHTAQLASDGGLARYRLTLAAWTHWLQHRRDTRVFQDRTARDILTEVFKAWPQARFRFDVAHDGPLRALCTQYAESDWAFAQRLMAQEGWSWCVLHEADEHTDQTFAGARAAHHTLLIFDQHASVADLGDLGELRYSRPDMRQNDGWVQDTLTAWSVGQRLVPNAVTLGAWDERQLQGLASQRHSTLPHGSAPVLETYLGHGERRHADGRVADAQPGSPAQAERRADTVLAAHELGHRQVQAQGGVRPMAPAQRFAITGHHLYEGQPLEARQFTVIHISHEAANNLGAQAAELLSQPDLGQGSYRNRFTAVPASTRLVPPNSLQAIVAPTAPGPQIATVVAAAGEPLHTDRDGRIRIQFAWQRGAAPLSAGLSAPAGPQGEAATHASHDERSGTWVRVAQHLAGPNWGTVFTPRAGSEVMVDFIDGDIDRPVVIGQLHHGQHELPWPAGVDTGANHGGTISGWHSSHLDGSGANQWLIDDATGQLRMRLASHGSQTGHSELSLGHLIQHSAQGGAGHAQRGTWLGSGFYGATDGWAIVRAAGGLLLSTSTRPVQGASVASTQMDAAEAVAQLKGAQQLGEALSQSARQQGAQGLPSHDAQQALQRHAEAMSPQAQGKFDGAVNGQPATKAQPGSREGQDPVERFAQPLIHLDTPVAASFVTPDQISLFSGQSTSLTAQSDAHLTAAHTLSAVSGQTTSLYTHSGGIKAITANAALSLRAHTDAQQIWSEQDLTVQSTTSEIRIQASKSITLTAGQSQIELKGGNITFTCPGNFIAKASAHNWAGPGNGAASLTALPDSRVKLFNRQAKLVNDLTGEPMAGVPYKATTPEGDVHYGTTDENGLTMLVPTINPQSIEFHWGVTANSKGGA